MCGSAIGRSVLAGFSLALLLALPAPAALESGVEDLPGTTWVLKGRMTTTARAQGKSAAGSEKSGQMVLTFLEAGAMRCESQKYGTITGSCQPVPGSSRKVQGVLDEASLDAALRTFEKRVARRVRQMVGTRVSVDADIRSTSFKGKLNRAGTKMRAKAKVRVSGRASAARGGAKLRGAFRFRLSGRQQAQGPIAWWPGDGNADDIVGDHHGTPNGGVTYAPGMVGQAFALDGVDDFIQIGDMKAFDITSSSSMSIVGWFKADSTSQSGFLACKGSIFSPDHGWWVNTNTGDDGNLRFVIVDDDDHRIVETLAASDLAWHFFAATHDGGSGEMRLYVDGMLEGSETEDFKGIDDGGMPLTIGIDSQGEHAFSGLIDELAFFDRALTKDEVKAIFDAGSAGMKRP